MSGIVGVYRRTVASHLDNAKRRFGVFSIARLMAANSRI
jgi:DNA-binding CsgD family transcriptional regulator